jgi:hypothetical protein
METRFWETRLENFHFYGNSFLETETRFRFGWSICGQ